MRNHIGENPIYILFVAVFLGMLGLGIVIPLLPILVSDLKASQFWIGALFAGYGLSRIIVTQPIGNLSDKYGRKWFITAGLALYAIVSLLYIFPTSVYELFAVRFIHGIASAMIGPVAMAYVGDITPPGKEGIFQGRLSNAFYLGLGSGPLIGGVMYSYAGINSVFILMAIMSFIPCLLCIRYLPESKIVKAAKESNFKKALNHPRLQATLFYRFMACFPYGAFMVYIPVLAATDYHSSTTIVGLIITIEVLSMGITQGYFGSLADRYKKSHLIVFGTFLVCFATLALPYLHHELVIFIVAFMIGIGNAISISAATAVTAIDGRELGQGVVMGAFNTVISLGVVIPPLIFGFMLVAWGINSIFIFSALLALAALVPFWYLVIRSRKWIAGRNPV